MGQSTSRFNVLISHVSLRRQNSTSKIPVNQELTTIKETLSKHKYSYVEIPEHLIHSIYDLFTTDTIDTTITHDIYYLYCGVYYNSINQSTENAERFYLLSIQAGNKIAMANLGTLYMRDEHKYPLALKYFKLAFDNCATSVVACNIGYCYEKFENNHQEAVRFYKIGIELGDIGAMCNLAAYYERIEKNYSDAFKYYKMATNLGDAYSFYMLGCFYKKIQHNIVESNKCHTCAIKLGCTESYVNLGVNCEDMKNYTDAIIYYNKGAKLGYFSCINRLGLYYANIENNYETSSKFFQIALDLFNNSCIAQYNLRMINSILNNDISEIIKCYVTSVSLPDSIYFAEYDYDLYIPLYALYESLINCDYELESIYTLIKHPQTQKHLNTLYAFYHAREPLKKQDRCPVCLEDECELIPYDCLYHYYCMHCYCKYDTCPQCKVPKNPAFANKELFTWSM
jgi:TPR repeat protein